jgi:hypothetical protein
LCRFRTTNHRLPVEVGRWMPWCSTKYYPTQASISMTSNVFCV